MSRKGQSVTLSLRELEKTQLEELALEFGCVWGDRPNISKLIKKIAKRELKIAHNNDWQAERLDILEKIRRFLVDGGQISEAIAITQLMLERSELKDLALRPKLERFLEHKLVPWRERIEGYIRRRQPFCMSYQDARGKIHSFAISHAAIAVHEKAEHLDIWTAETEGNLDIPELQHNWSLRLDRIQDASVSLLDRQWRSQLDVITVEFHLYGWLAFNYETKTALDTVNEWHPDLPETRRVKRQVSNTFWFIREILAYGKSCKIISPDSVGDRLKDEIQELYKLYE